MIDRTTRELYQALEKNNIPDIENALRAGAAVRLNDIAQVIINSNDHNHNPDELFYIIHLLIDHGTNIDLNEIAWRGHTLLTLSILMQNTRLTSYLISLGADIDTADRTRIPLMHAIKYGEIQTVEYILRHKMNRQKRIEYPDRILALLIHAFEDNTPNALNMLSILKAYGKFRTEHIMGAIKSLSCKLPHIDKLVAQLLSDAIFTTRQIDNLLVFFIQNKEEGDFSLFKASDLDINIAKITRILLEMGASTHFNKISTYDIARQYKHNEAAKVIQEFMQARNELSSTEEVSPSAPTLEAIANEELGAAPPDTRHEMPSAPPVDINLKKGIAANEEKAIVEAIPLDDDLAGLPTADAMFENSHLAESIQPVTAIIDDSALRFLNLQQRIARLGLPDDYLERHIASLEAAHQREVDQKLARRASRNEAVASRAISFHGILPPPPVTKRKAILTPEEDSKPAAHP